MTIFKYLRKMHDRYFHRYLYDTDEYSRKENEKNYEEWVK